MMLMSTMMLMVLKKMWFMWVWDCPEMDAHDVDVVRCVDIDDNDVVKMVLKFCCCTLHAYIPFHRCCKCKTVSVLASYLQMLKSVHAYDARCVNMI
jgi:hypothetical protein